MSDATIPELPPLPALPEPQGGYDEYGTPIYLQEQVHSYARSYARAAITAERARAAAPAGEAPDTKRLDWLLPNLHPATFGMDFPGGYEWDSDAEYLSKWRAAIDAELAGDTNPKEPT